MEKKHKCKLCFRIFKNGKALGGHMRSHLATASQLSDLTVSNSSLTSEEGESRDKIMAYVLRENPKKSFKLIDQEFLDDGHSAENRVSETHSTRIRPKVEIPPTKRPKWKKTPTRSTSNESVSELDSMCPGSDSFSSEEEIAWCLMKLSRDSDGLQLSRTGLVSTANVSVNVVEKRVFGCPFCDKVFWSGQALCGHKRSHFMPLGVSRVVGSRKQECLVSEKIDDFGCNLMDLNLPAPMED